MDKILNYERRYAMLYILIAVCFVFYFASVVLAFNIGRRVGSTENRIERTVKMSDSEEIKKRIMSGVIK